MLRINLGKLLSQKVEEHLNSYHQDELESLTDWSFGLAVKQSSLNANDRVNGPINYSNESTSDYGSWGSTSI